ncbi:MAG TPA: hypothetical protein VKU38_11045 [Ktedonobacteraceae bacterium]|nr:hypothetical protein [Ktedonobacteraceae bacterium]
MLSSRTTIEHDRRFLERHIFGRLQASAHSPPEKIGSSFHEGGE